MIEKKSLWASVSYMCLPCICVCWIHWLASSALLITLSTTISSPNTDKCHLATVGSKFSLKQWQLLIDCFIWDKRRKSWHFICTWALPTRHLFLGDYSLQDCWVMGKNWKQLKVSITRVSTQLWSIFIMKYNSCCWKWIRQYCIKWKQALGSLMGKRSPRCRTVCAVCCCGDKHHQLANSRPTQSLSPNQVTLLQPSW